MIEQRIIAIGDIHGCVYALDKLLDVIEPTTDDLVISLGDFIDMGRETADVVERLLRLESEIPLVALMGNHEEMLLEALQNESVKESWLMCGGVATLNSYKFCGDLDVIPESHLDFIRRCRPYFETSDHIFVHANLEADLPLEDQPEHALRWSLLDDQDCVPHVSGKTVIVGHTEQRDGEVLDLGYIKCIDTACHSYGWLTALEVGTGQIWQASRWGVLREGESTAPMRTAGRQLRRQVAKDGGNR